MSDLLSEYEKLGGKAGNAPLCLPGATGGRYPKRVRDTAFVLWWQHCDQSLTEVASVLGDDPEWRKIAGLKDGEPSPGVETISRWKRIDYWSLKLQDNMVELAPEATAVAALKMIHARANAADVLAELIDHGKPEDKVRMDAVKFALQSLSENLTEFSRPQVKEIIDAVNLEGMTNDELAEYEARVLDGGRRV